MAMTDTSQLTTYLIALGPFSIVLGMLLGRWWLAASRRNSRKPRR